VTTYTWQFPALDVYPTYQGLTNAVYSVHWTLTGNDGSGHVSTAYGSQALGAINPQNFTPFASLTAAQVQGWVEAQMGSTDLAQCKAGLDQRIAEQITPTRTTVLPPWY
jgi:hypothetical protein